MIRINDLLENRYWIITSGIIFFASLIIAVIIAILFPDFTISLFSQFFSDIQELGDQIFGSNPIIGTWKLFLNNFRASMVFIFGGIILTIPTIIGLVFNGGAIGALGVISAYDGINPLIFVLAIAPHGIFEIPAVLISGGFGLKIGSQLVQPEANLSRFNNFKDNLLLAIRNMPLIIILLIIAANIEIFVTPYLLQFFMDF